MIAVGRPKVAQQNLGTNYRAVSNNKDLVAEANVHASVALFRDANSGSIWYASGETASPNEIIGASGLGT